MTQLVRILGLLIGLLCGPAAQGWAHEMPITAPEAMGMSAARLERLDEVFSERVADGEASGYVIMVARGGEVVFSRTIGLRSLAPHAPMDASTLFRIASMTKPVMAVAALTLVEEGRLSLTDPVSLYLPEYGAMQVRQPDGSLLPQSRPITIRDLMIHTSGIGYRFDAASDLGRAYVAAAPYEKALTLAEASDIIAAQQLYFQPGESFLYSYGFDVLGRVIEVITGERLEDYLARVIFRPLDMRDTGFTVAPGDQTRLASVYARVDGALAPRPGTLFGDPLDPQTWPSGGAGLISTARDYLRFATMLERGGTLDGVQILSPASVSLMTSNHFPQPLRDRMVSGPFAGVAMGLGVAVVEDPGRTGLLSARGDFAWGGHYDTQFFVSPEYDLAAVILTQLQPTPGTPDTNTLREFRALVLAAVQE